MSGPFGSSQWMYSSGGASFYDTEIDGSLRLEDADNAYLSRAQSAGNRRTFTFSCWIKRSDITSQRSSLFSAGRTDTTSGNDPHLTIWDDDYIRWEGDGGSFKKEWSMKFRDPSAWYHIVLRIDSTQADANARVRLYVNGEVQTDTRNNSVISQNSEYGVNQSGKSAFIGAQNDGGSAVTHSDFYIAEVNFVDGSSLDPTSFGETKSGVWIPKAYSGSYGTNGFHLEFAGNANDSSGNGNNWTANNISSYDYVPDSPTNNFATLNPLFKNVTRTNEANYSQGNLRADNVADAMTEATMSAMTGKWYYEVRTQGDTMFGWGISGQWAGDTIGDTTVQAPAGIGIHANGQWLYGGTGYIANTGTSFNSGTNILMMAIDFDNNKIYYGKNGSWTQSGNPGAGTGGQALPSGIQNVPLVPAFRITNSASDFSVVNFGQDSSFAGGVTAQGNTDENGIGDFYYSVPTGFKAWCTANIELPEAMDLALNKSPEDYFASVLYEGNAVQGTSTTQSISVGFRPDLVWIKERSIARYPKIYDSVRGVTLSLSPADDVVERTDSSPLGLSSFDANGFTVGDKNNVNQNGETFVAWNWKAGGSAISNTEGSINAQVSANVDAGLSIISYTGNSTAGATIGHGLNQRPDVIIIKSRENATGGSQSWGFWHKNTIGGSYNDMLKLESSLSVSANNNVLNNVAPTDTLITLGVVKESNRPEPLICYAFHEVEGFSKFGVYEANQNSFGMFINTGFEPAFILYKNVTRTQEWVITTPAVTGYNPEDQSLQANGFGVEGSGNTVDVVSNGFKIRTSGSGINYANGDSIVYMAFARVPFKYANAR